MATPEARRSEGEEFEEYKRGFTRRQRRWIKAAYEEVMGFAGCVFPVWNETAGEYEYCRKAETQVHHIRPRGWCIRNLKTDPNVALNGAPLCVEHHINGQWDRPLTREAQDVIHLDIAYAKRRYKSSEKPSIFDRVMDQRVRLCGSSVPYWYELWDQYLTELAEEVVAEYLRRFPAAVWPKRITNQKKG